MEGVGARLGRSSSRYGPGPAAVFSGPVRKWKKKWVALAAPTPAAATAAANNASHLVLYKWIQADNAADKDAADPATPEPPPRRKFRYVPVSELTQQNQEAVPVSDDEGKPDDADPSPKPMQADGSEVKPDINDITMEEAQASEKKQAPADEVNDGNIDLNLGLKGRDGDAANDPKSTDETESIVPDEDVEASPAMNSEAENNRKRKDAAPDLEMRV